MRGCVVAGGAFLGHIQTTTGTLVQLRGRGSVTMEGPDPMHVFIAGPTAKAIDDARMYVCGQGGGGMGWGWGG